MEHGSIRSIHPVLSDDSLQERMLASLNVLLILQCRIYVVNPTTAKQKCQASMSQQSWLAVYKEVCRGHVLNQKPSLRGQGSLGSAGQALP